MNAQEVIQRWGLQPHPEGGYYRELYRSDTFTLNFAVRLRGVATHDCPEKKR
jgi:predicted cupin superfamily sugar epimerase